MDRVVSEVKKERLLRLDSSGDVRLCFQREGLGEEGVGAVILLQSRHGSGRLLLHTSPGVAVILPAEVARRRPDRRTPDIDVEAEVLWISTFGVARTEVPLADVDGAVALGLQQAR